MEFDDPEKGFQKTVRAGLPSVTFVDPAFGDLPAGVGQPQDNDDAPPSDLRDGQAFIATVVRTLFDPEQNPNWAKTMLILVCDEHGGFYDHVDPPADAVPLLGQKSGKLGPRVPAFVVSAWTPAGMVLKDVFDHSSIAATILRRFCSPHPPIMSPRVSAARDLRAALPLAEPRAAADLGLASLASVGAMRRRVDESALRAQRNPDDWGPFLAGARLILGATPRSRKGPAKKASLPWLSLLLDSTTSPSTTL